VNEVETASMSSLDPGLENLLEGSTVVGEDVLLVGPAVGELHVWPNIDWLNDNGHSKSEG
jgi:hypothetical protein